MHNHKMYRSSASAGKVVLAGLGVLLILGVLATTAGAWWLKELGRDLPPVESLRELQLSEPMRVFTADGALIGEFGAERRIRVRYEELPETVIQAFLAAEDERFYRHRGVDPVGLLRASLVLLRTGDKSQGGSTITMQLARNVFLTSEKTYIRKIREILLALRMEQELSKAEILELYLNKIFLGERAYGVAAAAQVYFNRRPEELTLAEAAVLAGLPKAPSRDNPIANPQRALDRRGYVLRRMRAAGFIGEAEFQKANAAPLVVTPYRPVVEVDAHYVAEMARAEMLNRYGEAAYTMGLRVTTTVLREEQAAAVQAVRKALLDYEERRGWNGPEARLSADTLADTLALEEALRSRPALPELTVAVIEARLENGWRWRGLNGVTGQLPGEGAAWARLDERRTLAVGDVIRLRARGESWRLAQLPSAQGALVSLNPQDGRIRALVGGYDFFASKFNRAVQGQRQAGSSFKPFLYAAAMERGFSPASVLLDAPVVFDDPLLESAWRPRNFSGKFYGPTRLREALVHSRNLVSIRLLQAIGFEPARQYAARLGLPLERMPRDLTMALGSAVFSPLELAGAFGVFANGGHAVTPAFIERVETADGRVLMAFEPPPRGEPVIRPATAWLITDILREVNRRGTAARVRELGRSDLAGKTGTTNDETDAWYAGYHPERSAVVWIGHDQPQPLGRGEQGGRTALPVWMDYMRVALKGVPEQPSPPPEGVLSVRIDPETGLLADGTRAGSRFEYVPFDAVPARAETPRAPGAQGHVEDRYDDTLF